MGSSPTLTPTASTFSPTISFLIPLILIVGGIIIVALVLVFTIRRSSSQKVMKLETLHQEFKQRFTVAVMASATVVSAQVVAHHPNQNKQVMHVQLSVTPPGHQPYFASNNWEVEKTALAYLQPGSEVAIKIDTQDASIIYPNTGWATYLLNK